MPTTGKLHAVFLPKILHGIHLGPHLGICSPFVLLLPLLVNELICNKDDINSPYSAGVVGGGGGGGGVILTSA